MSVSPEDPETYLSIFISDKTVMATSNRVLHILENLRVLSCKAQMLGSSWAGESPAAWSENSRTGAVTHSGHGISSPIITFVPLVPLHTPWGDCLEQWEPPTWSHLPQCLGPPLDAASCPCHSPDLPCLPHSLMKHGDQLCDDQRN